MDGSAPPRDIPRQREIIDRRVVAAALDAVALGQEGTAETRRTLVREILKQALADGRAEIRRRFERGDGAGAGRGVGTACVRATSFLVDQLVRLVHDYADQHEYPNSNLTTAEHLA